MRTHTHTPCVLKLPSVSSPSGVLATVLLISCEVALTASLARYSLRCSVLMSTLHVLRSFPQVLARAFSPLVVLERSDHNACVLQLASFASPIAALRCSCSCSLLLVVLSSRFPFYRLARTRLRFCSFRKGTLVFFIAWRVSGYFPVQGALFLTLCS